MSTDALPRHRQLGLTDWEADEIPRLLGREPTDPELVMFSLMWSEHCSYKHSKPLLRAFPTDGPGILQGPGENAGAIDVGDGLAVAFKIESHNHPSAVEPFEGAATGVGGIVRDIIAMGAQPIALLDSLRFGALTSGRSRYLFRRAVAGIGHYGNCIGVPTVGGEVGFDDCYEDSCLVNAMCVGIVPHDGILRAAAKGIGNRLVLIGNRTGRDGIGGASVLASAELSDDEDRRPSVQVSDPFTERKLMDCCAELARMGFFVALQDLGAAGLTSSSSEMASKGGVGLRIDLDLVPLRETSMAPAEILVSESQERMLAVVEPHHVATVVEICRERFDLDATDIGEVTDGDRLVAVAGGEVVADIPAHLLADDAPVYEVPQTPAPAPTPLDLATVPQPGDLAGAWLALLVPPDDREQALGVRAVRPHRRREHRTPPRAATRRWCACPAPIGRSRSPPTAPSATASSTRARAARRRSSRPPETSPAWAPAPPRSPTASTSPTRRRAPRAGGSPRSSPECPTPAALSRRRSCRATSPSTMRALGGSSTQRRLWAWWDCSTTRHAAWGTPSGSRATSSCSRGPARRDSTAASTWAAPRATRRRRTPSSRSPSAGSWPTPRRRDSW